jgi:Ca2+-binding RTX toxin-like protein
MIIDAKAARSPTAPDQGANPYVASEEPRSAGRPMALAALLSSMMLYLSSLWASEKSAAPSDPAGTSDDAPAEPEAETTLALADGDTVRQPRTSEGEEQGSTAEAASDSGSGGQLVDLQPAAAFQHVAGHDIRLPIMMATELRMPNFGPATWHAAVANDNSPGTLPDGPSGPTPGGNTGQGPQANRAPRTNGAVLLSDTLICATLAISMTDLLRGSTDPDGDALSIRNLTVSSGKITQVAGGWVYDPAHLGPVTIVYQITDGQYLVTQVARFTIVTPAAIEGTQGDDLLVGSDCGDDIHGRDGDDNIDARGGNDTIFGGDGDDHIVAGDGNDVVHAGNGNDIVFGGRGNDWISGGQGNDRLFGDEGDDVLMGDEGDDLLSGGHGNDLLFGGPGHDTLHGDEGDDRLLGEAGNDLLSGGAGSDLVEAGDGDDRVVGDLDAAPDVYLGGDGQDTLDYSHATAAILFDLPNDLVSSAELGNDTISGFEALHGGAGSDHFIAGGAPASFKGNGGDDTFDFGAPTLTNGQMIAYEIVDFMVGDRIRISRYELFEEIMDSLEDRFEDIYGDDIDDDDLPIRITNSRTDEVRTTLIEADLNGDDIYELSISLHGDHQITITELA